MVSFIHLRTHSAFSLSEGAIKINELIELCRAQKMPAVALTDTGNLFGSMEFCLEGVKAGIQPIIGCQLAVKPPAEDPRYQEKRLPGDDLLDTFIFLVQSEKGHQNLLKLVSRSFLLHGQNGRPFITFEMMQELHEGLIVLTGGVQGGIAQLLLKHYPHAAEHMLCHLKRIFDGRLYVEITRMGWAIERQCEADLIALAYEHGVPLVATNEAFFADESMYEAHDALLCIAEGSYVHQQDRRRLNPNYRFKSTAEMEHLFQDLPEALHNTVVIAQRCGYLIEPTAPILPPFPTENGEDEAQALTVQAVNGLKKRLQTQVYTASMSEGEKAAIDSRYFQRLEYELDIIKKMGFAGYYLIVSDFIKWAKSRRIPVGPGRGSGAGSLVAWSLTITDIDPIRWNLLFERFLNPERVSMPDFDIDFCQDRRDEVIDYVRSKYGHDRVAHIITFGKLQARAVVRDVGRVLGIPYSQVDRLSKLVPNNPAHPISLKDAIAQDPQLQRMACEDPQIERLLNIGQKLEGLYRHASTHAAGIVISNKPLEETVPLYYDGKSMLPATQYHMKHVELAGLVKFDFLGLKTLTVIQLTVDLARKRGFEVDISKIPLDDQKTFELLRRVDVLGVFQLESAGMRDVLRRLQPSRFEELIALVALYRPGPMDDIPRYLACKNGEEPVRYLHPLLKDILEETFGVMVYQEQVMQIAQVLAGYSLGGADLLRRAMGKKIKSEMDAQRETFIKGAQKNGIDQAIAEQIFEQAAKFAGYGFNKCHAAPYALIVYQTAYLKANFPVEFMAASMTYEINNTDKLVAFREDLNRMHIPLLPPDVNKSYPHFEVEQMEDGHLAIRYALAALKNVGVGPMEQLVAERQANGPFKDSIDLVRRLDSRVINRRMLESLIGAGAFDSLEPQREKLDASIDLILRHVGKGQDHPQATQVNLFGTHTTTLPTVKLNNAPAWSRLEKLNREFEAIGFYFSSHPLDIYGDSLQKLSLLSARELWPHFHRHGGSTVNLAGVVLSKKERLSKKGSRYAFVQFSDNSGVFDVTIFAEQYNPLRDKLEAGALMFLRVTGDIEEDSLRLTVQDIQELDQKLASFSSIIEVKLDQIQAIHTLKEAVSTLPHGPHSIRLRIPVENQTVLISLPDRLLIRPETLESIARIPGIHEVKNV
jgi:DNA polymerase-3 subunit alpha